MFIYKLVDSITSFVSEVTGRKGIVTQGSITLLDQGVSSGTNFLTSVIVARACSKEEFGFYVLGFSIVLFIIGTGKSIITSPYIVYTPRLTGKEKLEYTASTLVHQLGLSGLMTVSLIIAAAMLSLFLSHDKIGPILWILAATVFSIQLKEFARQVSFANQNVLAALIIDTSVAVIQLGAILLFAFLGILSASKTFLLAGAACSLVSISWVISKHGSLSYSKKNLIPHFNRNWLVGKWLFLTNLALICSVQLYPWLLKSFHGAEATAIFAVCLNLLFFANPFLLAMSNFMGPKTARVLAIAGKEGLQRFVLKGTLFVSLFMGVFSLFIFLFGSSIVVFIYGQKYAGNGLIVSLLALSQLALALSFPVNYGLLAMERADIEFKSYVLALVILLVLGLWLTNYYGPRGAASSLLASNLAASMFRVVAFKKCINARS